MGADVDGVLLAAGCSRRAGEFKMAAELAGKPLLLWGLDAMAAVCGRVIVVAGEGAAKVRRLVAGRPEVELVVNEDFASGMLSSVQAGARSVRAPRFFLLPGDMPLVGAGIFRQLLERPGDIVVPACAGHRGHPVLMSGRLVAAILAEPPDSSLGRFIRRHGSETVETGDPGVLSDLDDREDMKRIDALLRAGSDHE